MFKRQAAQVATGIQIEQRVLVEFACFGDLRAAKLDLQRVRILKIGDLHGLKGRARPARSIHRG
jgi:hypothetical protein